jgi:outer membrane lipoprotein-sorting protein
MNNVYAFVFLLMIISSCKSSREISTTVKPENLSYETVAAKFQSQLHDYNTASFKAKIEVKEKKTQNFTANVRLVRDSIIWASLTGTLGVEGARIIITKDTIHILDKVNKVYYKEPFSFIYQYVPFPVTMNLLQDILLGNHRIDTAALTEFKIEDAYSIHQKGKEINSVFIIDPLLFMPLLVKMNETEHNRHLSLAYRDYRPASDTDAASKVFSFHRIVDFKSGKKIKIDIKFLRINWNEELTFPFSVGDRYENKN